MIVLLAFIVLLLIEIAFHPSVISVLSKEGGKEGGQEDRLVLLFNFWCQKLRCMYILELPRISRKTVRFFVSRKPYERLSFVLARSWSVIQKFSARGRTLHIHMYVEVNTQQQQQQQQQHRSILFFHFVRLTEPRKTFEVVFYWSLHHISFRPSCLFLTLTQTHNLSTMNLST